MFKIGPMGDFYGGPVVKNLPSKTEDACLIPGQGTKIQVLGLSFQVFKN